MKKNLTFPLHKSFSFNQKWIGFFLLFFLVIVIITGASFSISKPYVISSTPANGATNISVHNSNIAADNLYVPEVEGYKGGVDNSTISNATVKLLKVDGSTTTEIMGVVQGTGGGDAISFSPTYSLEPNTTYKFRITEGVKSYSGVAFKPYEATFTTGADTDAEPPLPVEFSKVAVAGTQGKKYTSLAFGPDGRFYALRLDGVIERFRVNHADGTLFEPQQINTLQAKYGVRSAVGLVFDPAATASNLVVWVSHCSAGLEYAPEFDGNISRLSGSDLQNEQLVITKLPRSRKDHLVNSLVLGAGQCYIFFSG